MNKTRRFAGKLALALCGSLLGFARSQIDVSLTGLLDERDE